MIKRLLVVVFLVGGAAYAFNPQPDPPGFGMIGIVRGQAARLNVTIDNPNTIDNPDLLVGLQFVGMDGRVLKQMTARLAAGRSASFDFMFEEGPIDERGRVQIRAVVKAIDNPNIKKAPSNFLATVEVFDMVTGQTAFVLPGTVRFIKEVD